MKCVQCGVDKLSREFPREPLTDECDHPAMHCLRCTVKYVEENKTCPFKDCSEAVDPTGAMMVLIGAILKKMFYYYPPYEPPALPCEGGDHFFVALMNGSKYNIPYHPTTTIQQVKQHIFDHYKHERSKQRLMYNGKELKTLKAGGYATLNDYNIKAGSTVYLLVVLFAIPDDLNHIIFQLYWGIPANVKCDFLDASCFVYDSLHRRIDVVDYANEQSDKCGAGVQHSGDEMDRVRRIGSHRLEVKLKCLPANVTHLVFTLSAWDSNRISKFKDPLLKIFDASNIFRHLCQQSLSESSANQAVIVCCVYRVEDRWTIFESGCQTTGNTDNYTPIENFIKGSVLPMCM